MTTPKSGVKRFVHHILYMRLSEKLCISKFDLKICDISFQNFQYLITNPSMFLIQLCSVLDGKSSTSSFGVLSVIILHILLLTEVMYAGLLLSIGHVSIVLLVL